MRDRVALLLAALALLVPQQAAAADIPGCYMNIPRDARTIAFGTYGGSGRSPVHLTSSHRTSRMTVAIAKSDRPLFIVLSAYDPMYWDLKIEDGAEISGIVVFGYHSQAVGNVPPFVPVGFSTYEDGAGPDCPKSQIAYGNKGEDYDKFETMISDEFGKAIDEFHSSNGSDCLPKKCSRPAEPSAGFWSSLFGSAKPTQAAKPLYEVRASAPYVTGSGG